MTNIHAQALKVCCASAVLMLAVSLGCYSPQAGTRGTWTGVIRSTKVYWPSDRQQMWEAVEIELESGPGRPYYGAGGKPELPKRAYLVTSSKSAGRITNSADLGVPMETRVRIDGIMVGAPLNSATEVRGSSPVICDVFPMQPDPNINPKWAIVIQLRGKPKVLKD